MTHFYCAKCGPMCICQPQTNGTAVVPSFTTTYPSVGHGADCGCSGCESTRKKIQEMMKDARPLRRPATKRQEGGTHYLHFAIQPIDFIHKNGLGWCEGNIVKYVTRHKFKNGLEDLKKARHYLDKLIEEEEAKAGA